MKKIVVTTKNLDDIIRGVKSIIKKANKKEIKPPFFIMINEKEFEKELKKLKIKYRRAIDYI